MLLALFNLLPIPPLDGSHIVNSLISERLRPAWNSFYQLGPSVLLAVIVLPALTGASLLSTPIAWIGDLLVRLDEWFAGS